jgi:SAM-dependent methyltransferase
MLDGSDELNRVFYACRQRAMKIALKECGVDLSGLRVLDAGCGNGKFSKTYQLAGAKVWGVDISPDAVSRCESLGLGTFVVGSLNESAARFPEPFDIIHCFDVLYHLTDEDEWQSTLAAFAALSHEDTLWLLTEFHTMEGRSSALHLKKRPLAKYQRELARHGRCICLEKPLYWFYSVCPRLARRFPSWILLAERLGWLAKPWMKEYVALWVVAAKAQC